MKHKTPPPSPDENPQTLAEVDFRVLEKLRQSTDSQKLDTILKDLQEDMPKRLQELEQAVVDQDSKRQHELTHIIQSSAGSLGLHKLHKLSKQFSEQSKLAEAGTPEALFQTLHSAWLSAEALLHRAFPVTDSTFQHTETTSVARTDKESMPADKNITVLIADDDRQILKTLEPGFSNAGFNVLQATSGESALQLCYQHKPDIALLDLSMPPGITGIEVGEKLQQKTDIPFILMTGYDDEKLVETAARIGALGYLVKPMEVSQIIPQIKTALQRANDLNDLRSNESRLRLSLNNGKNVNMAIGILMERFQLSSSEAFDRLHGYSRAKRKKLTDISREIVNACDTLNKIQVYSNNRPGKSR